MKDSLRSFLLGGDRRSLARSGRALALVWAKPERVAELVALTSDEDWLVSQRALDLLEKLAREQPALIEPHKPPSQELQENIEAALSQRGRVGVGDGTSSVVVALDSARPRSRAYLIDPGVLYLAR